MGSKSETSLSRELRPTKERSADLLMLRTRYTLHQPGLAPPETRVRSGLGEPSNPRRLYQLRVRNDADDESHRCRSARSLLSCVPAMVLRRRDRRMAGATAREDG